MSMTPVGLYGLEVPPLGVMVPAMQEDSMPNACVSMIPCALPTGIFEKLSWGTYYVHDACLFGSSEEQSFADAYFP